MCFDDASNQNGFGASILLVSTKGAHTPISVKLDCDVTNNVAEHKACIIGLQAAVGIGVENVRVYDNS